MKRMFMATLAIISLLFGVLDAKVEASEKIPERVKATLSYTHENGYVKLSWEKVECDGYQIYRKEEGGKYKKIKTLSSDKTSYTDKRTDKGVRYRYKIRAFNCSSEGKKLFGVYSKLQKGYRYTLDELYTICQYPSYPNGCEAVSLAILLKYQGIETSPYDICEALPKGRTPYYVDGVKYGGNLDLEYLGNPLDNTGWGVHEDPIILVARNYDKSINKLSGKSLSEIMKVVSNGEPVQVWISIDCRDTYVKHTWVYPKTGEKQQWIHDLHSVVIVGETSKSILVSDPIYGQIIAYDKDIFEEKYDFFSRRAISYGR